MKIRCVQKCVTAIGCGGRIWTCDLQPVSLKFLASSLADFQKAPKRHRIFLNIEKVTNVLVCQKRRQKDKHNAKFDLFRLLLVFKSWITLSNGRWRYMPLCWNRSTLIAKLWPGLSVRKTVLSRKLTAIQAMRLLRHWRRVDGSAPIPKFHPALK